MGMSEITDIDLVLPQSQDQGQLAVSIKYLMSPTSYY